MAQLCLAVRAQQAPYLQMGQWLHFCSFGTLPHDKQLVMGEVLHTVLASLATSCHPPLTLIPAQATL